MEVLGDAVVRRYANIFAKEFQKMGLAGGTTDKSQDPRAGASTKEMRAAQQRKLLQEATDKKIKSIKKEMKLADEIAAKDKKNILLMARAMRARIDGEKKIAELEKRNAEKLAEILDDEAEAHKELTQKIHQTMKGFFSVQAGLGLLSVALTKTVYDFKAQAKFGVAMKEGTSAFNQMLGALKLGVDPELLSELSGQNRASVIAMGGVENWAKALADVQRDVYTYTLDLDETVRFTAEAFETLRRAGVEPTTAAISNAGQSLASTFSNIQKMSGQTFSEINTLLREFIASDEVRFKLMSTMDQKRRAQMVQEIAQRHEMLLGLGMTTEQAKRAGESLDRLAGKGPMERFKQAAKMQAVAGAMGMGAEGARAAEIMRKGRRATPAEQAELTRIAGAMQQGIAAAGLGDIGKEFTLATMVQKTGLEEMLGPTSPLSTALGEAFGPDTENAKNLKTSAEQNTLATDLLYRVSIELKNIKDNPVYIAILGALTTIGGILTGMTSIVASIAASMWLGGGGILKKLGKWLGSAAKTAGKVGAAGLKAVPGLGAAALAAKDVYDVAQGDRSKENVGALIGTGLGGLIGTAGGPMGIAAGASLGNWIGETIGAQLDKSGGAGDAVPLQRNHRGRVIKKASPTEHIVETLDSAQAASEKTSMETTNAIIEANNKILNSMKSSIDEKMEAWKQNYELQMQLLEEQKKSNTINQKAVDVQEKAAKSAAATAVNTDDTKKGIEGLKLKANQKEVPIRYPAAANPTG